MNKYNDLKMSILDKAEIGNSVQVNLELSKDRLSKEVIDAINVSSVGKIIDFRITDGKGIGVVLQLSNGKEQWFFEDEIDLLDENGNVIKIINDKKNNSNLIINIFDGINYENKGKIIELMLLGDTREERQTSAGAANSGGGGGGAAAGATSGRMPFDAAIASTFWLAAALSLSLSLASVEVS